MTWESISEQKNGVFIRAFSCGAKGPILSL